MRESSARHSNFHHATSKRSNSNSMSYFDFYFPSIATAVFRASTNVLLCFDGGNGSWDLPFLEAGKWDFVLWDWDS